MLLVLAYYLLECLIWIVLAGAILSWFQGARNHPVTKVIQSITDPLLMPFRMILPKMGGLDLSPMLAILLLVALQRLLLSA
jgi:YggT family protein